MTMFDKKHYKKTIETTLNSFLKPYVKICFTLIVFFLYALYPTISMAQVKSCALNSEKLSVLKKSATGYFTNINVAQTPYYAGGLSFKDKNGKTLTIADFKGKVIFLNLWATWCVPCREEMHDIAELQKQKADDHFAVVAVNVDKQTDLYVNDFLKQHKADNLPFYRDTSLTIFNVLRGEGLALGLPATVIIDKKGCLVANLIGAAPWGNKDALRFIDQLKAMETE